eukprot:TRINITY_DN8415_c0_g1_i1.p1 TRINITY_DN8415_c0_g1~~TRINITY_DN8415_c0_g1_i1.p1  ORF type:complete len:777 (-),score=156.57 TRINITY_DN8415_c0_g1_i1:202-2532(-)
MGRFRHKKKKTGGENTWKTDAPRQVVDPDAPLPPPSKGQLDFEKYYKGQCIVPEAEWDEYLATLFRPLPQSFRFSAHTPGAPKRRDAFIERFVTPTEGEQSEVKINNIAWYPNQYAWQMPVAKKELRKDPTFKEFRAYLINEVDQGNANRQEAVSMLPPMFLDIEPHHKVLDMCAAPGSKTSQLLERMHLSAGDTTPSGVIIANDANLERCFTLVHQVNRYATTNFIVTNNDAQHFPNIYEIDESQEPQLIAEIAKVNPDNFDATGVVLKRDEKGRKTAVKFDRILCDVPCSSDGTLRKCPDLWPRWKVGFGSSLHGLQLQIAMRGLRMLAVNGVMVYSTCSFNPIENEAVVAELVRRSNGSVELVDVSTQLPELKRRNGLHTWKVMSRLGDWYENWSEVPTDMAVNISQSMFPPTKEEAESLHLERCIRIVPHDQDTGGFFVAVLRKKEEIPLSKEQSQVAEQTASTMVQAATEGEAKPSSDEKVTGAMADEVQELVDGLSESGRKEKKKYFAEEPFYLLKKDSPVINELKRFYELKESFPSDRVYTRSPQINRLYLVSEGIKSLLRSDVRKSLKVVSAGIRLFNKHDNIAGAVGVCDFRLCQDSLSYLAPHMQETRIVDLRETELRKLLEKNLCAFHEFSTDLAGRLSALGMGCVVLRCQPNAESFIQLPILTAAWRGRNNINLLLGKDERRGVLTLISSKEAEAQLIRPERPKRKLDSGEQGSESSDDEQAEVTKEDAGNADMSESVATDSANQLTAPAEAIASGEAEGENAQ